MKNVFANWASWNNIKDKSKNYVIFYRELKYVNSFNIDEIQAMLASGIAEIGDVLIKNENNKWIHYTSKDFNNMFYEIN